MNLALLATATEIQQRGWELARCPQSWGRLVGVCLLAAICYAVVWLYRRERRAGAGVRLRSILAAVRCLVMLALAAVWLEPVIATYYVRSLNGRVAVLVDASASMSVRDAEESPDASPQSSAENLPGSQGDSGNDETPQPQMTRFERVRRLLLANEADWLRRLQERNDLSLYAFGDTTFPLNLPWSAPATSAPAATQSGSSAESLATLAPSYPQTDLGQALTAVLADLGEGPVAGVILISDGQVNRGTPAHEVAAYAERVRAPLFTIGVGSTHEPPNVRVTNLSAPAVVPPDDPFEVRVELAATGAEPEELRVELTVEPSGGGEERPVSSRRVHVGDSNAPVLFEVGPPVPGEYTYRARIQPLAGESVTDDNVRDTSVTVLDKQLRVLIVAGGPSYEYRYLLPLLMRDKTVNVSAWLQSAEPRALRDGTTTITKLPREPEEILEYDVILLLDPDPAELDAAWAVTVRRWVDEFGGGLLLQAGPQFASRLLRDTRVGEVVSILPITPDPDADVRLNAQGSYRTHPTAMQIPDSALTHPLLALQTDPAINRALWNALPGVWWYLPVMRAKPAATVLLEQPTAAQRSQYEAPVLMASQPVGAGRVAFMGFDTTWRWRGTAEEYYQRFWVRAIRYLGQARRQGLSNRGTLVLDRESFNVGDYLKVEARVLDASFNPLQQEQITATLEGSDGPPLEFGLQAVPERPGWYSGRVVLAQSGPALIRVPLPGGTASAGSESLTRRIRVQQPDWEMRTLRLREELLAGLAQQTGGQYVALRDAQRLPDLVPRAAERKPPQRAAVEPLWDRAYVLLLIAGLLSIEWSLRRRNHLL
mgnify:CR=1 FL=1